MLCGWVAQNRIHCQKAVNAVHSTLASRKITKIKFAWEKCLVTWARSEQSYFVGVNIAIYGQCSKEIC